MYQNSYYPLRSIVGNVIPIKKSSIQKVFESEESKNLSISYGFDQNTIMTGRTVNTQIPLPSFVVDQTRIFPGEGMGALPLPSPFPFKVNDPGAYFSAVSNLEATTDVSRKLSVRYSIQLPNKFLVGGVCFGGFPYPASSPADLVMDIRNSNFGLPREVRLTCMNGVAEDTEPTYKFDFLDAETSATKQDLISHSAFHFLCIDPTLTNVVTIHFSDYPTILKDVAYDDQTGYYKETIYYGFFIPHFYIFEYQEKTRYRPVVAAGLLGTKGSHMDKDFHELLANPGYYRYIPGEGAEVNYFDFTAASIFGQQRKYNIRREFYDGGEPQGPVTERLSECFISAKTDPGENVVLFIEQGEEYERCVAGITLLLPFNPNSAAQEDLDRIVEKIKEFYPNSYDFRRLVEDWPRNTDRNSLETFWQKFLRIPRGIEFCAKIGIQVYEIDPLEGVSPLDVPLSSKYSTLLADIIISELSESSLAVLLEGIKFNRPSNSKYFAIALTNLDSRTTRFVIKGLKLVQSAHVSVHPRAAKTQQVKSLNFRIIGPDLAEDYSFVGNEGFSFSIERFVAGERKSVLFKANSLLDLLHSGAAKIFGNARRRAVEKYKTKNSGWRRSETGSDESDKTKIKGINHWTEDKSELEKLMEDENENKFEVFNSQENRIHSQNLFPFESEAEFWNKVKGYFNGISGYHRTDVIGGDEPKVDKNGDLNGDWRNSRWKEAFQFPQINGFVSLSCNPYSPVLRLKEYIEDGKFDTLLTVFGSSVPLLITGGSNSSLSLSAGGWVGGSIGINPFPTINANTSYGSSGNVNKQATEAVYSYSQYLNTGYDENIVAHEEVPDTDRQRIKGAEVMWQGELADIITGSIPLNFTLPATAGKMHFNTADDSLRVRFGSGVGESISVDFWFDMLEEEINDDN